MLNIPVGTRYDKIRKTADINVLNCYYINVSSGWIHKKRFLDSYEMIFVTEGELYLSFDDSTDSEICLHSSEIMVIPQYRTISGTRKSTSSTAFYTVEFLCNDYEFFGIVPNCIMSGTNTLLLESLMLRLSTAINAPDCDSYIRDTFFLTILYELRRYGDTSDNKRILANRVYEYVNNNIAFTLDIAEISEHFNYNKDYISRIFKAQFNISLKEYITQKKLSTAKLLLVTSNLTMDKIAQAIGIKDISLFEKFFKYHEKITPYRYRKQFK